MTLLDDYAALRQLSSSSVPEYYWSIVDAAISQVMTCLSAIARAGDAAAHASLRDIAAAFEATATRTTMREIVDRARKLAAYTATFVSSLE